MIDLQDCTYISAYRPRLVLYSSVLKRFLMLEQNIEKTEPFKEPVGPRWPLYTVISTS
jgi:hypothetical protein